MNPKEARKKGELKNKQQDKQQGQLNGTLKRDKLMIIFNVNEFSSLIEI